MQVMLLTLATTASAADVVWLDKPDDATRAFVAEAAAGRTLQLIELRAAATAMNDEDQAAWANLEAALKQVREFEQKLDGELIIMRDLAGPLANISIIRNDADRDEMFKALAYQGFAVNRFFDVDLGTDDQASDYRFELNGLWVEKPWMHAVALDPDRDVTAYDIAEAPQRVAYSKVQEQVKTALPGSLVPKDLPAGATLVVNGRKAEVGPSGNLRLVPGRHLVHAELEGRVVARWDVTLNPGESKEGSVALTDATWNGWLEGLADGASVPAPIAKSIEALEGEVWLARMGDKGPQVYVATPDGVTMRELEKPRAGDGDDQKGPSLVLLGSAGWLSSGNFSTQDPTVPNTKATVNAVTGGAGIAFDIDAGPLRFGAGLTADFTLGKNHVALYGDDGATRLRPFPHVSVGIPLAQVALGYMLPHHPAARLQLALPLGDTGLEARGTYTHGLGVDGTFSDGSNWDNLPLHAANAGIGYRFGL